MRTARNSSTLSMIDREIGNFLDWLQVEKGNSALTIRNYRHYLDRFSQWLKGEKNKPTFNDITMDVVHKYRLYLSRFQDNKGATLSRKTQSFHIIALRSFLRWLIKNDKKVLPPEKIELPKVESQEVKFLNPEQVDKILNAPSLSTIGGKRDKAILEVLFSTGLRVSELAALDRDKIDLKTKEFGILGKGKRRRVVFLSNRAVDWIERYLEARQDNFKPLFIRHRGKVDVSSGSEDVRLSVRSIQRVLKKYSRKVRLPFDVTPHVLRHSFATDLLMAGADIRSVQEMLGHKNITTTQVYTHVTNKRLREIHESYHKKNVQ